MVTQIISTHLRKENKATRFTVTTERSLCSTSSKHFVTRTRACVRAYVRKIIFLFSFLYLSVCLSLSLTHFFLSFSLSLFIDYRMETNVNVTLLIIVSPKIISPISLSIFLRLALFLFRFYPPPLFLSIFLSSFLSLFLSLSRSLALSLSLSFRPVVYFHLRFPVSLRYFPKKSSVSPFFFLCREKLNKATRRTQEKA